MKKMNVQIFILFLMLIQLCAISCVENVPTGSRQLQSDELKGGNSDDFSGGSGNGNNVISNGDQGLNTETEEIDAKVEIRHIIEPKVDDDSNAGKYTRKLTLPKNYNGLLYISGINVASLKEKNLKVRFRFGLSNTAKDVDATITTAEGIGITSATNLEMLVMDMRNRPFDNIQLGFELFDYNNYNFSANATLAPGELGVPVEYNRDENLFCRGLRLDHDPTFSGRIADGCSRSDDVCKYAYAKVVDKGLVDSTLGRALFPDELNIASTFSGLDSDDNEIKVKRCLPDDPTLGAYRFDNAINFSSFGVSANISGLGLYVYQGPYQANDFEGWQIKNEAILSPSYGIFGGHNNLDGNPLSMSLLESNNGYRSKLFPLYSRFDLQTGVEYLGSAFPMQRKVLTSALSTGESQYLDGCNARVSSQKESFLGEHVGSCNVTSKIEIIAVDDDGNENIIDSSIEVKLQLVKPEEISSSGENLLLSSFQACNSSSQCGGDACCINKRCWSKTIVSQCIEDFDNYGGLETGDSCTSDHECASLCCNKSSGKCAVHDTNLTPPVLCSKPAGQSCIAKEFCQKHPVTRCFIVKTQLDAQGGETCALRCYNYEVYGDCIAGPGNNNAICVPPEVPEQPVFNPSDPNRCNEAIDVSEVPLNNQVDE